MKHFFLKLLKGSVIFHIEEIENLKKEEIKGKKESQFNRPRLTESYER